MNFRWDESKIIWQRRQRYDWINVYVVETFTLARAFDNLRAMSEAEPSTVNGNRRTIRQIRQGNGKIGETGGNELLILEWYYTVIFHVLSNVFIFIEIYVISA